MSEHEKDSEDSMLQAMTDYFCVRVTDEMTRNIYPEQIKHSVG